MTLAVLILLLLGGGLLAWLAERTHPNLPRWVALGVVGISLLFLLLTLPPEQLALATDPRHPGNWLAQLKIDWMPRFGIAFELAMDGLSLLLLVLTLLLGLVAITASWSEITFKPGLFQANLLWTLAGVCGVFLAMDLFLFFLFWEVMLIPMYLLIAIWGHENKSYAAMKFFIFTQASGLLMLLAIVVLAWQGSRVSGQLSFSYFDLLGLSLDPRVAWWTMLGFFLAFTVKLPAFPFHTWLPDAHTQAPTAGSVLLAGILLKTGAYGLLRFCIPLFPEASMEFAPIAMGLGVAGVIYGAVLAFAQSDFKRLVAYSSVSHMGFVLLGLFAVHPWLAAIAAVGLITAAIYSLWMMQQAFQGTPDKQRTMPDFDGREMTAMAAMMIALLWLGLYPQPVLDLAQPVLGSLQALATPLDQAHSLVSKAAPAAGSGL